MKKQNLSYVAACLIAFNFSFSQVQQHLWYLKDQEIDYRTIPPTISPIGQGYGVESYYEPPPNGTIGTAMHNASGEKILTVFNQNIHNKVGDPIGVLDHWEYGTSSPIIIPKPGSSCGYYIIYTSTQPVLATGGYCGLMGYFNTFYTEVDLTANSGLGAVVSSGNTIQTCANRFKSSPIAVSRELANGNRYLYALTLDNNSFKIKRYLISAAGISLSATIYSGTQNIIPVELELSHDGSKLAMADNSGNKVWMFHLNPSTGTIVSNIGNNADGTSDFTIPGSNQLTGVEFSPNGNYLFIASKGVGIYRIDLLGDVVNIPAIQETLTYGNTDLELAYHPNGDHQIYAISDDGTNMGAITLPNSLSPVFSPNSLPNLSVFDYCFPSTNAYLSNMHYLPKQIDGEDYIARFSNLTATCCNASEVFEAYSFSATTSATWLPGSNPFNNQTVVTVATELRIPAGKNITIKNMVFKFAPGAKVIVERSLDPNSGTGGKLTLDNTIFTVDDRCSTDMWQGVEVWGHPAVAQVSNSSKQGSFYMINGSKIEHAYRGALAGKWVNANNDYTYAGGIISSKDSYFYNNQNGVMILGNAQAWIQNNANLSYFSNNAFDWNSALKNPAALYGNHVLLLSTKNIPFYGNDFNNNSTVADVNYYLKGSGLVVYNSIFKVAPRCLNVQCSSIDKNYFRNLNHGVDAITFNLHTFEIDRSDFVNCITGTHVYHAKDEKITRNNYYIHENTAFQTVGLALYGSTGYTVSENVFRNNANLTPVAGAKDYGIVVINSGTAHNEIYKNTFSNLKIGGQSENVNGALLNNPNDPLVKGLQWKCNTFKKTILEADLTVLNGRIDYHQGYTYANNLDSALRKAARNVFSSMGEGMNLQHDIKLDAASQTLNYVYLADANQVPDSYSLTMTTQPAMAFGNPVYMTASACPSIIPSLILEPSPGPGPIVQLMDGIDALESQIKALKAKIDGGDTKSLVEFVNNSNSLDEIHSTLLKNSPYLSDEVLSAYIDRNPTMGQLKEILLANSTLSKAIQEKLETVEMPNGTRNQINEAQKGLSGRSLLIQEISSQEAAQHNAYSNLFHYLQMNATTDEFIQALESSNKLEHRKYLLEMYILTGNKEKEQLLRDELAAKGVSKEFFEIMDIEKELISATNQQAAFDANPNLRSRLEFLSLNAEDVLLRAKAKNMLFNIHDEIVIDPFLVFNDEKSLKNIPSGSSSNFQMNSSSNLSIYPNPATSKVKLDFQQIPDGKMEVQFMNLNGQIVYEKSFEKTNGEMVDVSAIHRGLYLVKVLIDKQIVEVQKLELK